MGLEVVHSSSLEREAEKVLQIQIRALKFEQPMPNKALQLTAPGAYAPGDRS